MYNAVHSICIETLLLFVFLPFYLDNSRDAIIAILQEIILFYFTEKKIFCNILNLFKYKQFIEHPCQH